ncbi:hypothetical protein GGD81_002082 [Rhodobium orientis]|uniref:BrnT family toxin n=1 Tax=Rhodobium orientis TaxID=34017 RepID=A0A327K1Y5_9HYPH|nr:BrnT family toxin [Rhodobium orientis]MBB4303044.1 hypothetical protein [Rhodobium orientis]MBK5949602.1 hypothetical protein [Rhodobium orientis]RAI29388.1 hypothetical protein CH339_03650 [Rhodobium orientis]
MAEWDREKNRSNQAKHGVAFEDFERFNWEFAACFDIQCVDGEEREVWIGPIDDTLHVAVLTMRDDIERLISLRRATSREVELWRREF